MSDNQEAVSEERIKELMKACVYGRGLVMKPVEHDDLLLALRDYERLRALSRQSPPQPSAAPAVEGVCKTCGGKGGFPVEFDTPLINLSRAWSACRSCYGTGRAAGEGK